MPEYAMQVSATSNSTINTEDTFVEISESTVALKIKKVRVRLGAGTETAGVDNNYRVRLVRKTAVSGVTPIAGTGVRMKQSDRATAATLSIKNTTVAFTTVTLGDLIDTVVKNGRETYEYIARDEIDYIETHPTTGSGGIFAVLIQSAVASQVFQVTVWWEE